MIRMNEVGCRILHLCCKLPAEVDVMDIEGPRSPDLMQHLAARAENILINERTAHLLDPVTLSIIAVFCRVATVHGNDSVLGVISIGVVSVAGHVACGVVHLRKALV